MGIRVLYSFPHRIGGGRICGTAWHQVSGVAAAGGDLLVFPGSVRERLADSIRVEPTLARGPVSIPYRAIGQLRALVWHDRIVARRLPRIADSVDLVHAWPVGSLETLRVATELGIPTLLERPNAHTRFAYEVVRKECERLGVDLPDDHEHAYNERVLEREEQEYDLADHLLCPSDFVLKSFRDAGYPAHKLMRHTYGYDETAFFPSTRAPAIASFTMLFVGVAAVRKGLHFALEAWLRSPASRNGGTFLIAGDILPAYEHKLAPLLRHPSVRVLGHRTDVPQLMRESDVLVLPTLEEGSALVCGQVLASGCVLLVSDAATGVSRHEVNALVHPAGDLETLTSDLTTLYSDRALLERLRANGLADARGVTWRAAGMRLFEIYRSIATNGNGRHTVESAP